MLWREIASFILGSATNKKVNDQNYKTPCWLKFQAKNRLKQLKFYINQNCT